MKWPLTKFLWPLTCCMLIFVIFASCEKVEKLNLVNTDYPSPTTESLGWEISSPPPTVCYELGECLNSNLIDVTLVNTTAQCLEDCKNTEGCQWFTYKYPVYRQAFCEHFETCNLWSDNCDNCTVGHVTCPEQQCNSLGRCKVSLKVTSIVKEIKYFASF